LTELSETDIVNSSGPVKVEVKVSKIGHIQEGSLDFTDTDISDLFTANSLGKKIGKIITIGS